METLKPNTANSSPLTPLGFLERTARIYGDNPSIIYNSTVYTWAETHKRCLRLASSLFSMGIKRGDVVSVLAPNIPAMYEMHFGVPMCGAILNTINIRLDARTISVILRHSEAKLVIVDIQSKPLIEEVISLMNKSAPPILIYIEDEENQPQSTSNPPSNLTYQSLIKKGDPNFKWIRPQTEWDPMILNYTSGTTSSPKGVVHSHRGLLVVTVDSLIEWSLPKEPVYLWTLPMFHANGWSYPWGIAAVGGTNICLRKFDASIIYQSIQKHNVTHLCCAPVVLNMLANAPESDRKPLPHPVHILTAGAPPPAAVLFRAEALGFSVTHGYGLTETGGLVVSCTWKSKWNHFPATEKAKLKARQGVRTPCMTDVDVIDPKTGESVKNDGITLGEIVLSGGSIMLGYLKNEEATSKSLQNGWFFTGDVGVMHPDGYLEIKDRSKDVIISGGENISSVEVESVLYQNSVVNEAAVVAKPDEYWGESPCAFVSLKEEYKRSGLKGFDKEIVKFCRERLPHYMVPKTIVFLEELPKTSTGKIQKFVLRDLANKLGTESRVSRM